MPRSIKLSIPSEQADLVIEWISGLDGVIGLERRTGASIDPAGDVIEVLATNDGL